MTDQKTAAEVRLELEEYLAVTALRVAVDTAVAICRDPNASAAARAAATNSLLRAGALGGFARNYDPAAGEKEPHEMTLAELDQSRRKLQLMREAREAREAIEAQNASENKIAAVGKGAGAGASAGAGKRKRKSAFD